MDNKLPLAHMEMLVAGSKDLLTARARQSLALKGKEQTNTRGDAAKTQQGTDSLLSVHHSSHSLSVHSWRENRVSLLLPFC